MVHKLYIDNSYLFRRDKEKQEIERLHNMTEAERQHEAKNNPRFITNEAPRGRKYKFLQKYYHRGAFFMVSSSIKLFDSWLIITKYYYYYTNQTH